MYTAWHLIQVHLKPPTSCSLSRGPTSAWSSRRLLLFTRAREALVHGGAPFCPFFSNPLLISRIIPYQHVRVPFGLCNAPSVSICMGFKGFFFFFAFFPLSIFLFRVKMPSGGKISLPVSLRFSGFALWDKVSDQKLNLKFTFIILIADCIGLASYQSFGTGRYRYLSVPLIKKMALSTSASFYGHIPNVVSQRKKKPSCSCMDIL